jgi:4-hydroxybenzoate polyprenyltransferase
LKRFFYFLQSVRPIQWSKNAFILIPLVFAQKAFDPSSLLKGLAAFASFCLLASGVYLFNDMLDLESDRLHPVKKKRPLAAGLISSRSLRVASGLLLFFALLWGSSLGRLFFLAMLSYVVIQVLYSFHLKHVAIIDVFCISAGFFLRIVAGALVIQVSISHWLIICSVLISMFLALAKRRSELAFLGEKNAVDHRKSLGSYSLRILDQMVAVTAGSALLSYMLYCVSAETIQKFRTNHLIYSSPFVLFGLFRYLYLIYEKGKGGAPEKVLVSDVPLGVALILWILTCVLVIYGVL